MCKKLLLLLLLLPFQLLCAQTKLLTDFPEGYTPEEVGKRLAYRFIGEKHALHAGKWIGDWVSRDVLLEWCTKICCGNKR